MKVNLNDHIETLPGAPVGAGFVNSESLAEQTGVKAPEKKADYVLDNTPKGDVNEALEHVVKLYEESKHKIETLEKNSAEFTKATEDMKKLTEEFVPLMGKAKLALGDGEAKPEWLDKVENKLTELRGYVEGFVQFEKQHRSKNGEFKVAGFCDDPEAIKKFNTLKYITGCRTGNWTGAEYEKDVAVEMARKPGADQVHPDIINDVVRDTDTGGGYMFPEGVMDTLIRDLVPDALPGALNVTVINDLDRNKKMHIPRIKNVNLGGWIAERGNVAQGSSEFDRATLDPRKFAGRMLVSNEAMGSITPAQDMAFRAGLIEQIQGGFSRGLVAGTGADGQPQGVIGDTDIPADNKMNTAGANGSVINVIKDFKKVLKTLSVHNSLMLPSNRWLLHGALATDLKFTPVAQYSGQTNQDNPGLLFPMFALTNGLPEFGGFPAVSNNYVPIDRSKGTSSSLTTLLFGPWAAIYMGVWRSMSIMVNPYSDTAFNSDQVDIRLIIEVDYANTRPEGFAYLDNIDVGL